MLNALTSKPQAPHAKVKKVFKSLSIDPALYAAAQEAAAGEERSFSYIVSRAISRDLARAAKGAASGDE